MAKHFENYSPYDELAVGKAYFEFDKEVKTVINDFAINGGQFNSMYNLIVKYLFSQGNDITNIRKLLIKHISLLLYYLVRKDILDNEECYKIPEFNDYISKDINIEKLNLMDSNNYIHNPFYDLFSCDSTDFKNIKDCISDIRKIVREINKPSIVKGVDLVSLFVYDYFGYTNRCTDANSINRFDLMIAHEINNPSNKPKFTFALEITSIDKLNAMWCGKKNLINTYSELLLGFVVNELFKANYMDFSESKTIKFNKEVYYQTMLSKSNLSTNYFKFIKSIEKTSNSKTILIDKIVEFDFIYNSESYSFTKNGIIKR